MLSKITYVRHSKNVYKPMRIRQEIILDDWKRELDEGKHDHPQGDYIYYRYIGYTVEMKRAGIDKPLALLDWLHMEVSR